MKSSDQIISILVAAYKAEHWLEECCSSVLNQTLPEEVSLELLIGVDGCRDTLDKAKSLSSPHVRVIYSESNVGTYTMFNTLMQFARGSRICRFDADDVMRDGYVQELWSELERGVDIATSWCVFVDEHLKPTCCVPVLPDYCDPNGEFRAASEGQFMMKRQVYDRLGGFMPWQCSADTEFHLRAQGLGMKSSTVEEFLFYRRIHSESLTTHPDTHMLSTRRQHYFRIIRHKEASLSRLGNNLAIQPVTASSVKKYW